MLRYKSLLSRDENRLFWVCDRLHDFICVKSWSPPRRTSPYPDKETSPHPPRRFLIVEACYQFCTICENFRFPSLTVQNRLFWARERLRDFILCKISQPLPILHNLWKFQLSIMGITFPKPPNTSYEVLAAPSFWSYWSNWIFGPLYRWLGRLGQRSSLFLLTNL